MPLREFELFHGAVLTKLVRSDRPLTLTMIETRPGDAWSTYRVNDELQVLVKYSVVPRNLKREQAIAWQFVFSRDQIAQLRHEGTWAALVCGARSLDDGGMEICLLEPAEVATLLDLASDSQQSVGVKRSAGRSLRALSVRVSSGLVIPRNRIDSWEIPGS